MSYRNRIAAIVMTVLLLGAGCIKAEDSQTISLAGQWQFSLDSDNQGVNQKWFAKELKDSCKLPGTTDENGLGSANTLKPEMIRPVLQKLTRKHSYIGPAWYQTTIEIPEAWKGKKAELFLERVLWESTVWLDELQIGSADSLVSPHIYTLDAAPGKHRLTIRIDNSCKYNVGKMAHALTEETQTSWNGIIGKIELRPVDTIHIETIQVWPDVKNKQARLAVTIQNYGGDCTGTVSVSLPPQTPQKQTCQIKAGSCEISIVCNIPSLWDEFTPAMNEVTVEISCPGVKTQKTFRTGFREFTAKKGRFFVNDRPILIRGTLECCIFPLTGYPPMNIAEWKRILGIAQSYGLNHLRFHSWCPPEAAFAAADEIGFYFQVELPNWVNNIGQDKPRDEFLKAEADRMIAFYGNHPSFCLWSMGNELEGDFDFLNTLVSNFKKKDHRHLYTCTTYTFQKPHGLWPEPSDDFYISQQTRLGWIRGQGFFNTQKPSTSLDFQSSLIGCPVPVLSHEIGQYSVYPNLKEIEKYTGVLEPLNFMAIRDDLKKKNLLGLAEDYLRATGMFSAILYKEDIELSMRTFGVSGYQLLDLHDFPGQGTALIGVLDAFWDSKGLITPEQFRRFSNSTVPLLRMDKRVFVNTEIFTAAAEVAHFGQSELKNVQARWEIANSENTIIAEGAFQPRDIGFGKGIQLGAISFDLKPIQKAQKLNIRVFFENKKYINDWDFWVYPAVGDIELSKDILIADRWNDEVQTTLEKGGKVLLAVDQSILKNKVQGMFVPVFWSPVHFPNQPGTMGILCDPKHPALADFPTEFHTNWQWWELLTQSVNVDLEDGPDDFKPIVRMVDNFAKNRKLADLFEAKVAKGKLLFCSIDIETALDKRPAARQLRRSLTAYINSDRFQPTQELAITYLKQMFKETNAMTGAKVIFIDSQQQDFPAVNALDNDPATIWHTEWTPIQKPYPHEIQIRLPQETAITGFTCLPRQDGNKNGYVAEYEFYFSQDGKNWGNPLAKGSFVRDMSPKKVIFDNPNAVYGSKFKGSFIRFVAVKGFDNDPYAAIAELNILTE